MKYNEITTSYDSLFDMNDVKPCLWIPSLFLVESHDRLVALCGCLGAHDELLGQMILSVIVPVLVYDWLRLPVGRLSL